MVFVKLGWAWPIGFTGKKKRGGTFTGDIYKTRKEGYIFFPNYLALHNKVARITEIAQFIYSKCDYTHNYPILNGMDNYPEAGVAPSQQGFCTKRDISKKEHFLSKLFCSVKNILSMHLVRQNDLMILWFYRRL